MRRVAAVAVVVLAAAGGACGGGEKEEPAALAPNNEAGLRLSVRHSQPLRAGSAVTWTLEVRNEGPAPVTLTYSSGQKGDVALYQSGQERYRWSAGKVFTEALSETSLASGQSEAVELKGDALAVAPGQYELVGLLTSGPTPPEVRQPVTVAG